MSSLEPIDELLFNLIHYQLYLTLNKKVCPLHYKEKTATYSIWTLFDPQKFLKQLQELVHSLRHVCTLENSVQQVYVDQVPTCNDGVFRYNPLYDVVQLDHELLIQRIRSLKINKKSRTLKIFI